MTPRVSSTSTVACFTGRRLTRLTFPPFSIGKCVSTSLRKRAGSPWQLHGVGVGQSGCSRQCRFPHQVVQICFEASQELVGLTLCGSSQAKPHAWTSSGRCSPRLGGFFRCTGLGLRLCCLRFSPLSRRSCCFQAHLLRLGPIVNSDLSPKLRLAPLLQGVK